VKWSRTGPCGGLGREEPRGRHAQSLPSSGSAGRVSNVAIPCEQHQTNLRSDCVSVCQAGLAVDRIGELFLGGGQFEVAATFRCMISLPGGGNPICDAISIPNSSSRKPFREHIPLEIFLVVDEHLVGLLHNPDLSMSVSNLLSPYMFPTYICVILDIHRVRNKCNRFPLEENLWRILATSMFLSSSSISERSAPWQLWQ
jgi:hypothetical protein